MYEVIGVRNDVYQEKPMGQPVDHYDEVVVATFDHIAYANRFIKNNRLANPVQDNQWCQTRYFKKGLLEEFESAFVREREEINVPHNPK